MTAPAENPAAALLQAEENAPALPEGATGFRERKRKSPPRPSTTVPGMTVGGVRRALNQIRRAGGSIRPEHLLFNGMPAGRFALALVLGMYSRRKGGKKDDGELEEGELPAAAEEEKEEAMGAEAE